MKRVSIHEAKTHLSRLVDEALSGEEIVISRRNEPLVRLTVINKEPGSRAFGVLPGLVSKIPEDFDEELTDWETPLFPEAEHRSKK